MLQQWPFEFASRVSLVCIYTRSQSYQIFRGFPSHFILWWRVKQDRTASFQILPESPPVILASVKDLRFPQQYWWELRSSVMWHFVVRLKFPPFRRKYRPITSEHQETLTHGHNSQPFFTWSYISSELEKSRLSGDGREHTYLCKQC